MRILNRLTQPSIVQNEYENTYTLHGLNKREIESLLSNELAGGGVFGLEFHYRDLETTSNFFAPNFLKVKWNKANRDKIFNNLDEYKKDSLLMQPYQLKTAMFPIEMNSKKSIFEQIKEICPSNINFIYQILLSYRQDNWRDNVDEQYTDYLNGIQLPSNKAFVRKIQRSVSEKIDNLLQYDFNFADIDEIDQKLKEHGFRYNIRILLYGANKHIRTKFAKQILELLNQDSYVNEWASYNKIPTSDMLSYMEKRKLNNIGKSSVLCESELTPFLLFNKKVVPIEIPVQIEENENVFNENNNSDDMSLLPKDNDIENIEVNSKELSKRFISALSSVNKKAKTKPPVLLKVENGATLIKLTYELSNGLRLSQINKKPIIEDIQVIMGEKDIAITQGSNEKEFDVWIPNKKRQSYLLGNYIETPEFKEFAKSKPLPFLVGVDTSGNPIYRSLDEAPHFLVCGQTGSGKSVWLNGVILTLLITRKPSEVEFYMIDVKQVELPIFEKFPHVQKVVTDEASAIQLLRQLKLEMYRRYELFKASGVKKIDMYNSKNPDNPLPYQVIVIDEYAELTMDNNKVHDIITSIAQLGRASGLILCVCTQRPEVKVIPGIIKANLPSKIGFRCADKVSYRTFLNSTPPFNLLGSGDGVMSFNGEQEEFIRFQGCLIVEDPNNQGLESELINNIAKQMRTSKVKSVLPEVTSEPTQEEVELNKLKQTVATTGEVRITQLQKLMKINMNRLKSLMDQLVDEGWIEPPETKQSGYRLIASDSELKKWRQ